MPTECPGIPARLAAVHDRVAAAARAAGRDPREVRVLLATKTQDAATVLEGVRAALDLAAAAGDDRPVLVGENRVQELVAKAPALADLVAAGRVEAHLIGHLQKNKVNAVLGAATAVDSVDSLALAQALSTRCARDGRTLDVAALPGLRLVGLMTIGARSDDDARVRAGFARLRAVRDAVLASAVPGTADAHELSMGMTGDLELAVAEGATVVRVGTAVFGARPTPA